MLCSIFVNCARFACLSAFFTLNLICLNAASSSVQAEKSTITAKEYSQLATILPDFEAYIKKAYAEWNAPGVAVAIVKDGKVIFAKGFGVRIAEKDLPVDEHTIFQIASLSKNMLAHLIAKLVEEKKLSFDDRVTQYLPNFKLNDPSQTNTITIRDLISHRIGLPGFSGDTLWYLNYSSDEIIEGLRKIPLSTSPRTKYNYQNQIFGLASLIAEKVTGKSIETLYKEYFFNPMEMTSASCSLDALAPQNGVKKILNMFEHRNIASPHDIRNNKPSTLPFSHLTYVFAGSTGINISISDYAKWMIMMLNKGKYNNQQIIQEQSLTELTKPLIDCHMSHTDMMFAHDRYSDVKYGMGFYQVQFGTSEKKVQANLHMGAFYGTRSLMMIVPSENLGIVVFSNLGSNRVSLLPETLINRFMDLYLGLPDVDWSTRTYDQHKNIKMENKRHKDMERLENPMPCLPLEQYIGTYQNELYGKVKVTVENSKLILHYRDRNIELEHFNAHQFSFPGNLMSPAYCETDIGYVYFGGQKPGVVHLLQIPSLLREGISEGVFEKE